MAQNLHNLDPRMARARRALALAGALALGIWAYAPALHAYFAQDDFAFLALVRLLHAPWLLFVRDHFPGSMYFRPLGVLVWWLVCAVAADAAWPQYALNLLLHLACVAALYALLQRLRRDASINALWAALYAVHPLAIGTALWLSDRFDLLATLFSLIATHAALRYTSRPRTAELAVLLISLLMGLLSKELGAVGCVAAFAAIALAPRQAMRLRPRLVALSTIAVLSVGWLAYRHAVLTPVGPLALPPAHAFVLGFWYWLCAAGLFLAGDPRAAPWMSGLLVLAALLWLGAGIGAAFARERFRWPEIAAVTTLLLLPGLVQAPVAVQHLREAGLDRFFFHLIVPSRFFHLSLAGLLCVLRLATTAQADSGSGANWIRACAAAGLALALLASAPLGHRIAHDYASATRVQIAPLAALESALDRVEPPTHACQIYLLHTSSLWGVSGYSDAIAKGLAANPERLAHCLVSTERPPWAYFVRTGSVSPADYRPLTPLLLGTAPLPVLTIGDVQIDYFVLPANVAAALPMQSIFLDYRDGRFVDVSEAVHAGALHVDFAGASP